MAPFGGSPSVASISFEKTHGWPARTRRSWFFFSLRTGCSMATRGALTAAPSQRPVGIGRCELALRDERPAPQPIGEPRRQKVAAHLAGERHELHDVEA